MEKYIHNRVNEKIEAVGGYYQITEECNMKYRGKNLLYLLGYAHLDNSCCGVGGCSYAHVIGYVLQWKNSITEQGFDVSQIEAVINPSDKIEIEKYLKREETVQQVNYEKATCL